MQIKNLAKEVVEYCNSTSIYTVKKKGLFWVIINNYCVIRACNNFYLPATLIALKIVANHWVKYPKHIFAHKLNVE